MSGHMSWPYPLFAFKFPLHVWVSEFLRSLGPPECRLGCAMDWGGPPESMASHIPNSISIVFAQLTAESRSLSFRMGCHFSLSKLPLHIRRMVDSGRLDPSPPTSVNIPIWHITIVSAAFACILYGRDRQIDRQTTLTIAIDTLAIDCI